MGAPPLISKSSTNDSLREHVFMFPHQRKLSKDELADLEAELLWHLAGESCPCPRNECRLISSLR